MIGSAADADYIAPCASDKWIAQRDLLSLPLRMCLSKPMAVRAMAIHSTSAALRGRRLRSGAFRLEDKVFLKRCGHILDRRIIAMEEMV